VGHPAIQHLINVHFKCKAVAPYLERTDNYGMLYFIFNVNVIGVLVCHNVTEGEYVFQIPYFPPFQEPRMFTPETARQLILDALTHGAPASVQQDVSQSLEVCSVKPWKMTAQVAAKYNDPTRRIFLAGDACHCFPPSGAFGMNTGIQDAHNLAWKLAMVMRHGAPLELLDSYGKERRPVAVENTELSVNNFLRSLKVPQAMGLDPKYIQLLGDTLSSSLLASVPLFLKAAFANKLISAGRTPLHALVYQNRVTEAICGRVQEIMDKYQGLQMIYPGCSTLTSPHLPAFSCPSFSVSVSVFVFVLCVCLLLCACVVCVSKNRCEVQCQLRL
jgi:hypothetical protein